MLAHVEHRFTVADYYRMAETGVLKPDARVELIDGKIIDMSPIGPFHSGAVNVLNSFFVSQAKNRWMVTVQNPVRLDDFSEPQPDLMLLKPRQDSYRTKHPEPADVFLLVEVSESSLELDRHEKLPRYGRAGISEVWIVNTLAKVVEVYRDPHFTGYNFTTTFRLGDKVAPEAFLDTPIHLVAIFGD